MSNVAMLEEELDEYIRLENEKKTLDTSLHDLSGKNDEESVRRINEISKRLGEINNLLSLYDGETLDNMKKYIDLRNKFNQITENIKKIEELSKEGKRPNSDAEFVTLSSSEGRNKSIDKRLVSEYMTLVEEKKKVKTELDKSYNLIKGKMSLKEELPKEEKKEDAPREFVLPIIENYDDLKKEDKIKETNERLERIFASAKLPNMGKKVVITHNGEKYEIPEKYKGYFKATVMELSKLTKEDKKKDEKKEDTIKVASIIDNPKEQEALTREKEMYEKLGVPFDPERQKRINELVVNLFEQTSRREPINFRKEVHQKIVWAKNYVNTISKKTSIRLKEKYNKVKEVVNDKKEEISYQIVNRSTKFKENVCLKVNEKKSKVAEVNKKISSRFIIPFDKLRERKEMYVPRSALFEEIKLLKEQNTLLREQNKTLTRKLVNNSGFVSTAAFVITVSIAITIAIFLIVGIVVFR